jgi:hypothetical protein
MNTSEPASMTDIAFDTGVIAERSRIINLLLDQNIIRRCAATDKLVAFNTHGTEVVYIKELETK